MYITAWPFSTRISKNLLTAYEPQVAAAEAYLRTIFRVFARSGFWVLHRNAHQVAYVDFIDPALAETIESRLPFFLVVVRSHDGFLA